MKTLLFLSFLLILSVNICFGYDCKMTVDGKNYDLSPLSSAAEDYIIGRSVTKLGWDFVLNLCIPVLEKACSANVGICQVWNYNCFFPGCGAASLGSATAVTFSTNIDNQLVAKFDKGEDGRISFITFTCDKNGGPGKPTYVDEKPLNQYQFAWTSQYACPGGGSSSGGGGGEPSIDIGWILIIVCGIGFILYLVIGILIKKFKFGAEGSEMIPNKEFWVDLPALIKDGFMFMVNKTCRRNAQSF